MPYNDVLTSFGLRRNNYIIFQCLPNLVDRRIQSAEDFYWYLITNKRHRQQTVAYYTRKWAGEVNSFYIYHYSLGNQPLVVDPCYNDSQFLALLKALLWSTILEDEHLPIPQFYTREINESIVPF